MVRPRRAFPLLIPLCVSLLLLSIITNTLPAESFHHRYNEVTRGHREDMITFDVCMLHYCWT